MIVTINGTAYSLPTAYKQGPAGPQGPAGADGAAGAPGASAAPVLAQVDTSPFTVLPEHTVLEVNVSPAVLNFPSLDDADPGAEKTVVDRANNASLSPIEFRYLGVQFGSINADGKSARVYASTAGWRQHQF